MEILAWLVPAGVVALLTMLWAAWAGRPRREERGRTARVDDKFVKAILKEHPAAGRPRPVSPRDRSTGIAVRPSRASAVARGDAQGRTRRSA